jgi:Fe-S-cluster containining protein
MGILQRTPWYAGGLAFECGRCGRCCAGPEEGYVWVNDDELRAIAGFLRADAQTVRSGFTRRVGVRLSVVEDFHTHNCIFLTINADGRGVCAIYPVRPAQCRTWPFWVHNLRNPEDWLAAGERCLGVNRGQLHPLEEIERKRKQSGS